MDKKLLQTVACRLSGVKDAAKHLRNGGEQS